MLLMRNSTAFCTSFDTHVVGYKMFFLSVYQIKFKFIEVDIIKKITCSNF